MLTIRRSGAESESGEMGKSAGRSTGKKRCWQKRVCSKDREPLTGKPASASEGVSEREGFQRFLEVFRGFQRFSGVFKGPLRDPLSGRFSSQRLLVLLPLIVLPLNLSPNRIVGMVKGCPPLG